MRKLGVLILLAMAPPVVAEPVIIGHRSLPALDVQTLRRIYTGRVVQLDGIRLVPLNLPVGNDLRERFLRDYLEQDEGKYTGYWTVRRYVGKGTPPKELADSEQVIRYVESESGAIGYVDEASLPPGAKVLLRP